LIIWIDAQLSPALAPWITATFGVEGHAVRELGLHRAKDPPIFQAARDAEAVVMTKDSDFLVLLDRFGPPPQILWITCGNTSNARLKEVLRASLPRAVDLLGQGERLVEISDAPVTDQGV
jgi:predicted nuclease of predicted toxin-antitoxin system